MKLDNAAQRLLNILEECKTKKGETPTRIVWREVLMVNSNEEYILMDRLGKLMSLPSQIITTMEKNFPDRRWEKSIHWQSTVNRLFKSINLNVGWESYKNSIDERTLSELAMLSMLIETKGHINELSSEQLSKFKDKINNLKEEIIDSDISENLKECFTKYLNKIIESIDLYEITGVEPIIEAIESTLGHSFVNADYRGAIQEKGFGRKLMDVLNEVAVAVTLAQGLPAIGIAVMNLLPK